MTPGLFSLAIPRVTVNDDVVTISRVAVSAGSAVKAGDVVLSVSTDKADVDVEAGADGYIWPLIEAGDRVPVGTVAALISASASRPPEAAPAARAAVTGDGAQGAPGGRATRRAAALARDLGIDLSDVSSAGIIREADVEAMARSRGISRPGGAPHQAAPGAVDPEFLAAISKPDSGFSSLSSDLKVMLYRRHGALIGPDVTIGAGSALYAEAIEVGEGTRIGKETTIRAQTLSIGAGALIGDHNDILCRRIRFGEML